MTDERYTFVEDCREKKRTATGAFHKRTHAGKGGRVRFPSDYKTKKELKAMNGAVKSYKLNERMSWVEFKKMPDDLKKTYICGLRKSFGVPNLHIAKMFGVSAPTVMRMCEKLDISNEREKGNRSAWNKEAFEVWCNGGSWKTVENDVDVEKAPVDQMDISVGAITVADVFKPVDDALMTKLDEICTKSVVPTYGSMTFNDCGIDEAMDVLRRVIGDTKTKITVTWAPMKE